MKPIQFSAQIEKLTANSDKTVSLKIGSQELPASDVGLLVEMFEKQIWIALAETPIKETDLEIPEVLPDIKDEPSPSKRLKNRLFVYWKEKKPTDDFLLWYIKQLDNFGQKYLDALQ